MARNQLSRDVVEVGDIKVLTGGQVVKAIVGTIARTDTAAKTLGVIPASAVITGSRIYGAVGSDAATTAILSLGKAGGTGTEFVNGAGVKGAAGVGEVSKAAATVLGTVGSSPVTLTGIYGETGTASTTGGPWTVVVEFVTV